MTERYLECGFVQNTHGVKGLLRVAHYCDSEKIFCSLPAVYLKREDGYRPYRVRSAAVHGAVILLALEGIETLEAAVAFKNKTLYAAREDLPAPEGAYFIADLIGLPVIDRDTGKVYGTLADVVNHGASDVYEVKTETGVALIPAVPAYVAGIEPEKGIFVTPIEGMF